MTEKPLSEPYYNFEFSAGNRNLIEPSIDISGPLTKDGKLLYRLNALYRREDYFRDFDVAVERFFIAPVLQWKISDCTDLFLNFEYLDDQRPADFGLVAIGDRVADIPFDRNLGELDDEQNAESIRASYRLEHRFDENWTFKNAFNFLTYDTISETATPLDFDETTGIVTRFFEVSDQPTTQYELQTNLTGEFQTGSINHQLLVGVDLQRRDDGRPDQVFRGDFDDTTELNIFNPVYGAAARPALEDNPIYFTGDWKNDRLGVFLQDLIALSDNLKLLGGIRYDAVWQDSTTTFLQDTTETSQFTDAFSPRLGIVYQPIEELSLYSSYSRSFFPNSATNVEGEILPVERGDQFEIGVRGEFLNDRLTSSLALFNLTRQNVATTDPNNPNFSVSTGEQRSRGVELDIAGEILPGWNVIANYAYIDAEITEDNDLPVGNRLFNVPENNFNLWTKYEFQTGSLQDLGLGLGFNFVGERFGDLDNSFTVDSYFLTNAAISYERNKW
ncbi:TonB-dependent siderophore receptor [Myxosarcina sp. GI1(2024)]